MNGYSLVALIFILLFLSGIGDNWLDKHYEMKHLKERLEFCEYQTIGE